MPESRTISGTTKARESKTGKRDVGDRKNNTARSAVFHNNKGSVSLLLVIHKKFKDFQHSFNMKRDSFNDSLSPSTGHKVVP